MDTMSGSWSESPLFSTHTISQLSHKAQGVGGGVGLSFLPQFIAHLPLFRVRLNLLHNDVGIQHPQENPNLANEHPLQPLSQLTDVDIQDDLH